MPFQREQMLAGLRVPDFQRPILATAGETFAVRAERHAVAPPVCPLSVRYPWPVRVSHTFNVRSQLAAGKPCAVGAEGHALHFGSVPLEGLLIAVEEASEVAMLPTAQLRAAAVE